MLWIVLLCFLLSFEELNVNILPVVIFFKNDDGVTVLYFDDLTDLGVEGEGD